jgi:hypothetical protein
MKAHVPTDESRQKVRAAASVGLPQELICGLVGVKSEKTLRLKYRKEILEGRAQAGFNVAKTCYERAMAGDPGMIRWWTATQLKWKESQGLEVYTPPGKAVVVADEREDTLAAYWKRKQAKAAEAADDPGDGGHLARDRPGEEEPPGDEGPGEG